MTRSLGAYVTDSSGKIYDVNAQYLFDPKLSTYVTIPANGSLTIIGNSHAKNVFVVSDGVVTISYGGREYGPTKVTTLAGNFELISFLLDGKNSTFTLLSKENKNINVYFITYENVELLGVLLENNITPVSGVNPIPSYLNKVSSAIASYEMDTEEISNDPFSGKTVLVQEAIPDNTNPKIAIFGGDLENPAGYQFYDLLKNLTPVYGPLPILIFADLRGDGVKRGYLFGGSIVEVDISGPPYPTDTTDFENRAKTYDVNYAELYKAGVPQGTGIGCTTYNIEYTQCPMVVGDIDLDGQDELIVHVTAQYSKRDLLCTSSAYGYIKYEDGNFVFKLLSQLSTSCAKFIIERVVTLPPSLIGGPNDAIVTDYDGDGIPEIYFMTNGNCALGQIRKTPNGWETRTIDLITHDEKAEYGCDVWIGEDISGKKLYIARMVLFNGKIYIKTPTTFNELTPNFELKRADMPGVGLRVAKLFGSEYLVTIVQDGSGGSYVAYFNPNSSSAPILFRTPYSLEDPKPATWDMSDNSTIFAVVNTDTEHKVYKLSFRMYIDAIAKIKDGETDTYAKVDNDKALITGLDNANGVRINPATEETLENVRNILNDMKILTDEDVDVDNSNVNSVENPQYLTDLNLTTYAEYSANANNYVNISFKTPVKTRKVYIYLMNYRFCPGGQQTYINVAVKYAGENLPTLQAQVATCTTVVGHGGARLAVISTDISRYIANMYIEFPMAQTVDIGFIGIENPKSVIVANIDGVFINPATEDTLSKIFSPIDEMVLNDADVKSAGSSAKISTNYAKELELLIKVGTPTGSPKIQFHIDIIGPDGSSVIKTYDGNTLSAEGTDYIYINNDVAGKKVVIRWDGTLDDSNYFSGVYAELIGKR